MSTEGKKWTASGYTRAPGQSRSHVSGYWTKLKRDIDRGWRYFLSRRPAFRPASLRTFKGGGS